jgi:hypothetical protein
MAHCFNMPLFINKALTEETVLLQAGAISFVLRVKLLVVNEQNEDGSFYFKFILVSDFTRHSFQKPTWRFRNRHGVSETGVAFQKPASRFRSWRRVSEAGVAFQKHHYSITLSKVHCRRTRQHLSQTTVKQCATNSHSSQIHSH